MVQWMMKIDSINSPIHNNDFENLLIHLTARVESKFLKCIIECCKRRSDLNFCICDPNEVKKIFGKFYNQLRILCFDKNKFNSLPDIIVFWRNNCIPIELKLNISTKTATRVYKHLEKAIYQLNNSYKCKCKYPFMKFIIVGNEKVESLMKMYCKKNSSLCDKAYIIRYNQCFHHILKIIEFRSRRSR